MCICTAVIIWNFRIVVCKWSSLLCRYLISLLMQLFFQNFFQIELLGLSTRRLLKADAIPTIFLHNSQTIPKKRISSIGRETMAAKQQVGIFPMINFLISALHCVQVLFPIVRKLKNRCQICFIYRGCNEIFTAMYLYPSYTIWNMLFWSKKKNANPTLKLYNLLPPFFQRVPKRNFN